MTDTFELRLAEIQPELLTYLARLVANIDDAQDLRQNVSLKLWQQRAAYRPEIPLIAWAKSIAYYEVLSWRKERLRETAVLSFSDEAVKTIADYLAEPRPSDNAAAREAALLDCYEALPRQRKQILDAFYRDRKPLRQIGRDFDLSYGSTRNLLAAIRDSLRSCVEGKLGREREP